MTDLAKLFELSLAYGQDACETRQAPRRERFIAMAMRSGISFAAFAAWAKERTWR